MQTPVFKPFLPKFASWMALALSLSACASPSPPVLVAGQGKTPVGQPLANFAAIQDLAIDSHDNIYVSDGGSEPAAAVTLRKISADGTVTTLGGGGDANAAIAAEGSLKEANLAGLKGIAVRGDQLYLTGLNCLRTVDLKATSDFQVKTYWGSCQSASEYQTALSSGSKPTRFNEHLLVTSDNTVYADVADKDAKHIFKLASGQKDPESINYAYEVLGMSIDSQGSLFLSHPWPDAAGPGYIEKWAPPQVPLRIYPGAGQIITDTHDNLYFLDGTTIARYTPANRRSDIGRLSESAISSVARLALNPGESTLYVAVGTAIYKFPLPKN